MRGNKAFILSKINEEIKKYQNIKIYGKDYNELIKMKYDLLDNKFTEEEINNWVHWW